MSKSSGMIVTVPSAQTGPSIAPSVAAENAAGAQSIVSRTGARISTDGGRS